MTIEGASPHGSRQRQNRQHGEKAVPGKHPRHQKKHADEEKTEEGMPVEEVLKGRPGSTYCLVGRFGEHIIDATDCGNCADE